MCFVLRDEFTPQSFLILMKCKYSFFILLFILRSVPLQVLAGIAKVVLLFHWQSRISSWLMGILPLYLSRYIAVLFHFRSTSIFVMVVMLTSSACMTCRYKFSEPRPGAVAVTPKRHYT